MASGVMSEEVASPSAFVSGFMVGYIFNNDLSIILTDQLWSYFLSITKQKAARVILLYSYDSDSDSDSDSYSLRP